MTSAGEEDRLADRDRGVGVRALPRPPPAAAAAVPVLRGARLRDPRRSPTGTGSWTIAATSASCCSVVLARGHRDPRVPPPRRRGRGGARCSAARWMLTSRDRDGARLHALRRPGRARRCPPSSTGSTATRAGRRSPTSARSARPRTRTGCSLTEFWNRSLEHVYSLDGSRPGPGPTGTPDIVSADGTLSRMPTDADYVLADNGISLQAPIVDGHSFAPMRLYQQGRPVAPARRDAAGLLRRLGARLVDVHVLQAGPARDDGGDALAHRPTTATRSRATRRCRSARSASIRSWAGRCRGRSFATRHEHRRERQAGDDPRPGRPDARPRRDPLPGRRHVLAERERPAAPRRSGRVQVRAREARG